MVHIKWGSLYIVVISLLVGFWPTLDNFESTFSSILLGCLSFLLFKGNLEVSDIGLLVGTLAACATGRSAEYKVALDDHGRAVFAHGGDRLFLYTDGLTECLPGISRNKAGQLLKKTLQKPSGLSATHEEIVGLFRADDTDKEDDCTWVYLEKTG